MKIKEILILIPFMLGYFFFMSFMQILVYYSLMPVIPKLVQDVLHSWVPGEILIPIILLSIAVGGFLLVYVVPLFVLESLYDRVVKK
jgi:hypothetical protein